MIVFYQILCQDFISFNLIYSCFPGIMLQSNRQLDFCGLYFTRGTDMLRFWTVGMRIWIISMGNVYNEISSNSNYATANFHYRQVIWVFVSFYSHFQLIWSYTDEMIWNSCMEIGGSQRWCWNDTRHGYFSHCMWRVARADRNLVTCFSHQCQKDVIRVLPKFRRKQRLRRRLSTSKTSLLPWQSGAPRLDNGALARVHHNAWFGTLAVHALAIWQKCLRKIREHHYDHDCFMSFCLFVKCLFRKLNSCI